MNYQTAWHPIAAFMSGMREAALLHSQFMQSHNKNPYGVSEYLQRQYKHLLEAVRAYKTHHGSDLPPALLECLDRFCSDPGSQIEGNTAGDELLGRAIVVKIAAFSAEVAYHLSDETEAIRSRCELSFFHLQRLIIVDKAEREKWQQAYEEGETSCEKLGSVHLLWHGIWAFKVDAIGARTDLIFPEPPNPDAIRTQVGFVLTEWKLGHNNSEAAYRDARKQAQLYAAGPLNGVELRSHRYAVVVSKKQTKVPPDIEENAIVWRHINIAVDPDLPSIAAKKIQ